MTIRHSLKLWLSAGSLALLTACGTTAPTRFYTLEPASSMQLVRNEPEKAAEIAVAVGPFRFADYLNRPHIVTRESETELKFAEFDRWGAPLRSVFQRTIAANLAGALESQRVFEYPTAIAGQPSVQVSGRVTRFDTNAEGQAVLIVQWSIKGRDGRIAKQVTRTHYEHGSSANNYRAKVQAQSETVAAFSRDIANAILNLEN